MYKVLKSLVGFLRPYKLLTCFFCLALSLDLAFISLAPLSFKFMVDLAIVPKDFEMFYRILILLGIAGVIGFGSGIASDYALSKLSARIQRDLRSRLFNHMQRAHIGYFKSTKSSDNVSYVTSDVSSVISALHGLLTVGIQSLAVVAVSTIALFVLQWSMALCVLAGAAVIFLGPYLLGGRAQRINAEFKEQSSALIGDLQENIKAQGIIKGFNLQQAMIDKFNERLQALFAIAYKKNVINANLERIPMISLLIINLLIVGLGSYLALHDMITVGALIAFFTMYTSMGNSVFNLTFAIPVITDAKVSLERIQRLLDARLESSGREPLPLAEDGSPAIEAKDVFFGYEENRFVLNGISLSIPTGTTAAFVGSSGSGKSTMLQLMLGFYEANEGQLRINGLPMDQLDKGTFRNRIGIVFQENLLFRGTIIDNLLISKPDASIEEVVEAASRAEIDSFIQSLPNGYHTEVLDEGSNFSGGQRQRLAIARAILRDPSILFLDEATSALDPVSEASINETFRKLASERTVVTVTHRLSSIKDADQIFAFDQGRLVESGSHDALLAAAGFYKGLWDKQSGLSISQDGQEANVDADRLSRLPFFQGIDREVLNELKDLFFTETFHAGAMIIQEGEPGDKFYIIARGRVAITKRSPDAEEDSLRLAILEDGDHFGEIALLDNVPRTATVTAISDCTFLTLQRKLLHYMLTQYPELDARVREKLRERTK